VYFGSDAGRRRFAYRDKKIVGVFVRFRAPLQLQESAAVVTGT
jgi:hypothetical protein